MGRKPTFTSAEEMQEKIDAYFASCEPELLRDGDGTPMLNKNGEPVYVGGRPMTIQGLALALGFTSRQSLLNYKAKRECAWNNTQPNGSLTGMHSAAHSSHWPMASDMRRKLTRRKTKAACGWCWSGTQRKAANEDAEHWEGAAEAMAVPDG